MLTEGAYYSETPMYAGYMILEKLPGTVDVTTLPAIHPEKKWIRFLSILYLLSIGIETELRHANKHLSQHCIVICNSSS